jgi:hypothetical protein
VTVDRKAELPSGYLEMYSDYWSLYQYSGYAGKKEANCSFVSELN